MTPEQIERLLQALEKLVQTLDKLAASSGSDPYRDLKVFFLGLMTAFVAGYFSHWLTVRREEGKRKLEEWERLKDWDRDGRKDDLRGTDLTPPWLWLRLRLPRRLALRLPKPRYLDLTEVNLGVDEEHEKGAILRRAKLPWARLLLANLQEADLLAANLQGALLVKANLQGAVLRAANLQGAALALANLQGADLGGANLQGAYLWQANLQRADLEEANLQGAFWDDETVWPEGFTPPEDAIKKEKPETKETGGNDAPDTRAAV